MNVKPVDKTKKSNIKCEHCKYWQGIDTGTHWLNYHDSTGCVNPDSLKYNEVTNYWNRCKKFKWRDEER